MKPLSLLLLSALCAPLLEAQQYIQRDSKTNIIAPSWMSASGADFLGSGRAGIARAGYSTAAFSNPAAMRIQDVLVNIEFAWRPSTPGMWEYDFVQQTHLPTFVSVGASTTFGGIQGGYARTYEESYRSHEIEITTESQPEGSGRFARSIFATYVHTAFVAVHAQIVPSLSLGASAGIDVISMNSQFLDAWSRAKGSRLQGNLGILYSPVHFFTLAASYHYGSHKDLEYTSSPVRISPRPIMPKYEARTPPIIDIGLLIHPFSGVAVMASTAREDWRSMVDGGSILWQTRLGVEVGFGEGTQIQTGYFTQRSPISLFREYYDQKFVTLGIAADLMNAVRASFTVISSMPFRNDRAAVPYFGTKRSFVRTEFTTALAFEL